MLTVVFIFTLVGCSGTNSDATTTWRHGILNPQADAAWQYMALEKGYFSERGIDFEIVPMNTDSTLLKALIAGEIDSMETSLSGTLVSIEQGTDLKILGSFNPITNFWVFSKDDINSIQDLSGRTVGVAAPGSYLDFLMRALLRKHNVDASTVEFVSTGDNAQTYAALVNGNVDAVDTSNDFIPMVEEEPGYKALVSIAQELPEIPRFCFITTQEVIDERSSTLQEVIDAYSDGVQYAIDNPEEAIKLGAEITKRSEDDIQYVYDSYFIGEKAITPNFKLDPESIMAVQEENLALEKQKKIMPIESVTNFNFQPKKEGR